MKMNKLNAKYQEIFRNRLIENGINVDNIWEIIKNEQLGTYNKLLNEIIELQRIEEVEKQFLNVKELRELKESLRNDYLPIGFEGEFLRYLEMTENETASIILAFHYGKMMAKHEEKKILKVV
ncbi:MAG: hypothetical protein WAO56_01235 [Miniphocaeibacter sp.]|uniref:hypothetical protein n=1 Tax=Miniphocaeibacter sp. TaxID=3100973 RepID=UPI00179D513B|nr:hypothetical protein [Gallicola sp.]